MVPPDGEGRAPAANRTRGLDAQSATTGINVVDRDDIAALADRLRAADLVERRLQNNWQAGWRACELVHADDYERGFADGVIALKRAHHDAHRLVQDDARRWTLRGEPRTRETFANPHPDDFLGRVAATRPAG